MKKFEKFCPKLQGRIFQFFLFIGNATTLYFHSEISWPLVVFPNGPIHTYIEKNKIELIIKLKLYKWIFLNKKGLYTQQKSDIHNKLIRKKRMSWRIITHPRKMKALTDLLVTLPLSSMFFFSDLLKVAFFRKCDSFFKSPKKKIFQKTILN